MKKKKPRKNIFSQEKKHTKETVHEKGHMLDLLDEDLKSSIM